MNRTNINEKEINSYFFQYIEKVDESMHLLDAYLSGRRQTIAFFENIPSEKYNYRYEEGKWSIKEVLQHLIDTERIFAYRILRISRGDKTSLQGFDQDIYIEPSGASRKTMENLLSEYRATRQSSIALLKSLKDEDLEHVGTASNDKMSARGAAFVIPGHDTWHIEVIKERYLE